MAIYRIQLVDGDRNLKTDMKAPNVDSARNAVEKHFDGTRWRVVEVRLLAD